MVGETIYKTLQNQNVSCAYIHSGSSDQNIVAKMWNDNELRVLITTTLGLVGNESSRTQMVCIVGMHYDLPSIIQAYGRVRPKRRTKNSKCLIYTAPNNYGRLKAVEVENTNAFNELVGSGIMNSANAVKYNRSMTMAAVNDWLFKDQGCRIVSLAGRLGFQHHKCSVCDMCTDTCVNILANLKGKKKYNNNVRQQFGVRLLTRMKHKCLGCNKTSCNGSCVVTKMQGIVCYHCLGNHVASKCPKQYKSILKGKACYSCYMYNYSEDVIHDFTTCSGTGGIKERLRGLIQYDYLEKRKKKEIKVSFISHLAGIFATSESFFMFLYKYRDWK